VEPSGRNQRQPWQKERSRKALKPAKPLPSVGSGCRRIAMVGGVDGSSPSELHRSASKMRLTSHAL
jgi:hypothetical protein